MEYKEILQFYKKKNNIRKAMFVELYYIKKLDKRSIMGRMIMNDRQVFYRLKRSIQKDIAINYQKWVLDREWLWWYYYSWQSKNLKKSYFIKLYFIEKKSPEYIMEKLYMTRQEFYRTKDNLILEAQKKNEKW